MLDGRRIWLVSGTIAYARLPRDQWADRIHAAKAAGLNTIEVPVFWNRHEARPGKFDFTGDADLRHFIQLCNKAGLWVILRVGPFVGQAWDQGGLPAWLGESAAVHVRTANGPFLEACSRFISALADQVRDLQITAPGEGGPIILLQFESRWTCGHETLAMNYLGELARYLREAGLTLPTINDHNMWQASEGQVDCWTGSERMLSTLRQLTVVRPDQPKLVIEFDSGSPQSVWGHDDVAAPDPWALQRRLAEVICGGGQFNLSPFAGGSNFGFWGGRLPDGTASFATAAASRHAPVSDSGVRTPSYFAVRRLATFASRFARVFASFEPGYQPVILDPVPGTPGTPGGAGAAADTAGKGKSKDTGGGAFSVAHVMGVHGGVAFVFATDDGAARSRSTALLMPDGSNIPVYLGKQRVAWVLLDTNITARSRLDYSTFNAFGMAGKAFVCFGPAGVKGVVSINGSPLEIETPAADAKKPVVIEHEGVFVVAVNDDQIDQTFLHDDSVYVGVLGMGADGRPIVAASAKQFVRVNGTSGEHKPVNVNAQAAHLAVDVRDGNVSLGTWTCTGVEEYVTGESARFARIPGPADLSTLGCPFGYGWYRVDFAAGSPHRPKLVCPSGGDRLHIYAGGEECGIIGVGPGATRAVSAPVKKHTRLVILAENLGRFAGGTTMLSTGPAQPGAGQSSGDHKGVTGDLWEHEVIKPGKPKVVNGEPMDILTFRAPLWEVREGDTTSSHRVHWTVAHKKKAAIMIAFDEFPGRALLVLNGKAVGYVDRSGPDRIVLPADSLTKGNNSIELALVPESSGSASQLEESQSLCDAIENAVHFYELTEAVTTKGEWWFAKWEPPGPAAFEPAGKKKHHGPTWWCSHFKTPESKASLMLDLTGMTKGQIYVNRRHLARYFVATADGTAVPPHERVFVPRSFLKVGEENEIVIFDEHGGNPTKLKLSLDAAATPVVV